MENTVKQKKEIQRIAGLIAIRDDYKKIENIAGVDSIVIGNDKIIAAAVVCDKELNQVDKAYSIIDINKDDRLLYKELPAMVEAVKKLKNKPDVLLVNGHGIADKKLGLASYIGIAVDLPAIGIAQKLTNGIVLDGLIYARNEIKGYEFITREGSNPVYVSPGHKVSIKSSINIVKECVKWPHKLPEPLALAHKYANKIKRDHLKMRQ